MTFAVSLLALVLHTALLLALAPALAGLLEAGRARLAGRAGPPLVQPWRDLARLLRKEPIIAEHASFVTPGAPYACLAATSAAGLLVPSFTLGMLTAPAADLFVLLGLLGLARMALALAALDSGMASGVSGAGLAGLLAVFAEPALALVVFSVALIAGGTNLDRAAAVLRDGGGAHVPLALAAVAAALAAVADLGPRAPGSARDAGLPDLSGRHLALVNLSGQLRTVVWLSLLAALFLPFGLAPENAGPVAWLVGLLAWAAKLALLAAGLLAAETVGGAARRLATPGALGAAVLLALLAAVLALASQGAA